MAWVRIDDGFAEHPKVLKVGGDAAWLHVAALCHCNRVQTDGVIHAEMLQRLSDRRAPHRLAAKLVEVGIWDLHPDGWVIHDYLDYQPSRDEMAARRQLRAQAGRLGGLRSAETRRAKSEATDEANSKQVASPLLGKQTKQTSTPSRPVPSRTVTSSSSSSSLYGNGPFDDDDDGGKQNSDPDAWAAECIDAIIGLSVVYKALDNLGAYQKWFGVQPNTKAATLIFGLLHGTGLASKILDYQIADDGLLANLIAFNVGVEIGQLLALAVILIVMGYWRRSPNFMRQATVANIIMIILGLILTGQQVAGYIASA